MARTHPSRPIGRSGSGSPSFERRGPAIGLVLASGSPQRRALLEALGLEIEVVEPMIEEITEGDPEEIVLENARWKAATVSAAARPGSLVIGGDTEVALDGKALGQPAGKDEARSHLELLSGREHQVLGAIALLGPEEDPTGRPVAREGVASSTVRFRELEPLLIDAYLASGEWRGRAGSYAIQGLGSALVEAVRGDVSNVIGLPVGLLLQLAPELVARR